MIKIFKLWSRMSNIYSRSVPFVIFLLFITEIILVVQPAFSKYLDQSDLKHILAPLAYIFIFVSMVSCIKKIIYRAVFDEFQLKYWLGLSDKEYYLFIIHKKIGWYYIYLCVMFTVTWGSKQTLISWGLIYTIIYLIVTYCMFLKSYKNLFLDKKNHMNLLKKQSELKFKYKVFKCYPKLELILLNILQRYVSFEGLFIKVIIICIIIIIPIEKSNKNFGLVVYIILNTILVLANEEYWDLEYANISFFRNSGISYHKYFFTNFTGGILFNALAMSIILMISSKSLVSSFIFICISSFIIFYCNLIFIFIGMYIDKRCNFLRIVVFVSGLIIGGCPLINLLFAFYLYNKISAKWEGIIC